MAKPKDKAFFLQKLEYFFNPERMRRVYGPMPDGVIREIQDYYSSLSDQDKKEMENAVMGWLEMGQRRMIEGVRLCGELKLRRSVDRLLEIGATYSRLDGDEADTITCFTIAALGNIGETRAIDFLQKEAVHCAKKDTKRSDIAVLALSRIDLEKALTYLPAVIRGDLKNPEQRGWYWTEQGKKRDLVKHGMAAHLFDLLLSFHDETIVPKMARHLQELEEEEKTYALKAFRAALERLDEFYPRHEKVSQEAKAKMWAEFEKGVGL